MSITMAFDARTIRVPVKRMGADQSVFSAAC